MACQLTKQELADLVRIYKQDPTALADAIRVKMDPSWGGKIGEVWKAGLLSAPPTHLANTVGNALNLVVDLLTTGVAGAVDPVLAKLTGRARERYVGEAGASLSGMRAGLGEAWDKLKTEVVEAATLAPERLVEPGIEGKLEHPRVGAIGGRVGRAVRIPFRLLEGADQFFKHLITHSELHRIAFRDAMGKGLSGTARDAHMAQLINEVQAHPENHEAIVKQMADAALLGTFQQPAGKAVRSVLQWKEAFPVLEAVMPFVKTPANIAKKTLRLTPAGFVDSIHELTKGINTGAQSDKIAQALIGSVAGAGLFAMARAGMLTGSGPGDDRLRRQKEQTGWQPYSVRWLDAEGKEHFVSFQRFEPVGALMSLAADAAELKDETKQGDTIHKLLAAATNAVTSKTYLEGLSQLFRAWSDPTRYAGELVKGLAGSAVPAIVGRAAVTLDPVVRDTRGEGPLETYLVNPIKARLPGVSETLPARTTGTGEEVRRQGGPVAQFLSPAKYSETIPGRELQAELTRIRYAPSAAPREVTDNHVRVPLTYEERRIMEEALRKASDRARREIATASYKALDDTSEEAGAGRRSKQSVIQGIFEGERSRARARIVKMSGFRERRQKAEQQRRAES